MDDATLKALQGSIAKWEAIVAGTGPKCGCSACALCHEFADPECTGCPVAISTGKPACKGTPYARYHSACMRNDEAEKSKHARAELDFLKSLLPADQSASHPQPMNDKTEES